jgi:aminocarboxymuconate-semialdehyde decarboxylase
MELGDRRLRPFWEAAEAHGTVVYIHPAGNASPRFEKWYLWNSIGQAFEEAMATASLFYEGVLEAYPNLKICVSHGGGYMPYYMGRIARNYLDKPATRVNVEKPRRISAHARFRQLRLRAPGTRGAGQAGRR